MYVVLTRITFFSADVVNLSAKIILPTLKLQNVAKSEDNFHDIIALPEPLSMFGCEILCY